jgi:hypothetical protein
VAALLVVEDLDVSKTFFLESGSLWDSSPSSEGLNRGVVQAE